MLSFSRRVLLFFGAFFPLFVIGFIQAYYYRVLIDKIVFASLLVVSIVGILFSLLLVKDARRYSSMNLEIKEVDDRAGVYTMYLISYISLIPLFVVPSWAGIVSFIIIILVMLSTYINSDLIFYNPLFIFQRYKLYSVELRDGDRVYILSKQSLKRNREIDAYLLTDYFYVTT